MKRMLKCSAAAVMGLGLASQAQAAGTTAGTSVTNSASVGYSVGGVSQNTVASNSAVFLVDRRVNLTVAEVGGGATTAPPGSTRKVTTFSVTNTTNSVMDFRLVASQDATGASTTFSHTDNFDVTTVGVFVDVNGNGSYDSSTDTATFLDELAADATKTVFIVADIPAGRADNDTAGVTLTAISAAAGTSSTLGADMVQTTAADTAMSIDTVFGDGAGKTDAARDGKYSDSDEFRISSATITLVKSSKIISDPFNGTTLPKAIPGAVIEYCIQVQNSGGQAAAGVTVSDTLPGNTTFVTNSIYAGGTVSGGVCAADGTAEDDNNTGSDESDPNGGDLTSGVVSVTIPTLATATTTTARFRVTIN